MRKTGRLFLTRDLPTTAPGPTAHRRSLPQGPWIVAAFLAATAVGVYFGVWHFSFVNFDDPLYVTANRHVQAGLSAETIGWAFSGATAVTNYWAPLTWISFLVDFELYGLDPGGYHLTNLMLHIANTLLLFRLLYAATGAMWKSAFVAALFCVHPLHVESVAWVTERKDVLSTFFWLLTMAAYGAYARQPGIYRYLSVAAALLLGLMAKPMLVTLPFVLLLWDYWPLGRLEKAADVRSAGRLVAEKIPLFAMVAAVGLVAFAAQKAGGAVKPLSLYPLEVRAANVALAYLWYLYKAVWPAGLAVIYPYPVSPSAAAAVSAAVVLAAATIGAVAKGGRFAFLPVGWLWYLGTLVPVIGWVVIGQYAVADRYSYVSLIGVFLVVAWGAPEMVGRLHWRQPLLKTGAVVVLIALAAAAFFQVRHWRNSEALFRRALAVTEDNFQAHNNLGRALSDQGRHSEAARHYRQALQIQPGYLLARMNLAVAQARTGNEEAALENFRRLLAADPDNPEALYNLARFLAGTGRAKESEKLLSRALEIDPDHADAHRLLASLLARRGQMAAAEPHMRRALSLAPADVEVRIVAGEFLISRGKAKEGRRLLADALQESLSGKRPPGPEAKRAVARLGRSMAAAGNAAAAEKLLRQALRAAPEDPDFRSLYEELAQKNR